MNHTLYNVNPLFCFDVFNAYFLVCFIFLGNLGILLLDKLPEEVTKNMIVTIPIWTFVGLMILISIIICSALARQPENKTPVAFKVRIIFSCIKFSLLLSFIQYKCFRIFLLRTASQKTCCFLYLLSKFKEQPGNVFILFLFRYFVTNICRYYANIFFHLNRKTSFDNQMFILTILLTLQPLYLIHTSICKRNAPYYMGIFTDYETL